MFDLFVDPIIDDDDDDDCNDGRCLDLDVVVMDEDDNDPIPPPIPLHNEFLLDDPVEHEICCSNAAENLDSNEVSICGAVNDDVCIWNRFVF